jgi:uncharacterized tellurite resistance protein B-like protein
MTPLENLHIAIGELAFAVARADGAVQQEELKKFNAIVAAELRYKHYGFEISDIIFQVLQRDDFIDTQTTYNWAMKEIRMNSHYLSPELKQTFIKVMEKVAKAFPPVTVEEMDIVERFKKDIEPLHGDPVYYEANKS